MQAHLPSSMSFASEVDLKCSSHYIGVPSNHTHSICTTKEVYGGCQMCLRNSAAPARALAVLKDVRSSLQHKKT